ncbi:MAG TPA: hypothetical protein VE289_10400 [Gaiellaceae bacterium]|jgi:hypothetical protein|nr:hypothetical protein [Gaiellaceae bacterium]
MTLFETIAVEAEVESPLWARALLRLEERELLPVFSPLGEERFAVGLESIYEGYLLHYGRPRLFAPGDGDTAVLLGDYLYAHGLVRIAAHGEVDVVGDLAELLSVCAQLRAEDRPGDGAAWAATVACLGGGEVLEEARAALRDDDDAAGLLELAALEAGRDEVECALALHAGRVN